METVLLVSWAVLIMESKGKFFTYAIIQATAFLPYLLFILMGNAYDGWLGTADYLLCVQLFLMRHGGGIVIACRHRLIGDFY